MEELLFQRELNIDSVSARWNCSECLLTVGLRVSTFRPQGTAVNSAFFIYLFILLLHKHTLIPQKSVEETHKDEGASSR